MGIEQVARTPAGRSLITRIAIGAAKYAAIGAAVIAGTYAAWRHGGETPADRERRAAIEETNTRRNANPGIAADQATVERQREEAKRNQNLTEQQTRLAAIRAANPGITNEAAQAKLRAELEGAHPITPPAATPDKTKIWGNETCDVNGLSPLSAPSGSRFNALQVECGATLASDPSDSSKTSVTVQKFERNAAGQIVFGDRDARGLSLPKLAVNETVLGQISANGQAVTIPGTPSLAGADNVIVRLATPAGTTVESSIRIGQNPAETQRFNP